MMNYLFEVGSHYQNEKGKYEVLANDGEWMQIRYEDGTEQTVKVDNQARIWERIQDEISPRSIPSRHSLDDDGLDTQPIGELVQAVLLENFAYPYPEDITLQVCLAIERNPDWLSRYENLIEHFSSQGKDGRRTVNTFIGWYTKEITGMVNLGQLNTKESGLIQSYSRLGYPDLPSKNSS